MVARHADVLVVSEGTLKSEPVISAAYRYHVNSAYHDAGYSEYVASRYPLRTRPVPDMLGQAVVVEVMAPAPFLLIGVHLPRAGIDFPYLHGNYSFDAQRRAVQAMNTLVHASALPVVVAGDMNISDRTATYGLLVAHRRDAMRAGARDVIVKSRLARLVPAVEREIVAGRGRHGITSSRVLRIWARVSHRIWRTRCNDSPSSFAARAALPPGKNHRRQMSSSRS